MASFQPLSVLFYREGFYWRQLATVPDVASQSELINFIISLGATRSGDWYEFPVELRRNAGSCGTRGLGVEVALLC